MTSDSGAYLFRPKGNAKQIVNRFDYMIVSKGPVMEQVIVKTSQLIMMVRLFHDPSCSPFFELFLDINTIPANTELVARFALQADDATKIGKFFTYDGLNFVRRTIVDKAPLGAKFYPSVNGAVLQSEISSLTVLTDHTMASTAINNELEFLIHRRLKRDDYRGINEPNNDESSVSFRFFVGYDSPSDNVWKLAEQKSRELNFPLTALLSEKSKELSSNEFKPLVSRDVPIISFKAKSFMSHEVILRTLNYKMIEHIFNPKQIEVDVNGQKSLNLRDDISYERLSWKAGHTIQFPWLIDNAVKITESQNTQEEGVFLSDEAVRAASRKMLSTDSNYTPASKIYTFLITLRLREPLPEDHPIPFTIQNVDGVPHNQTLLGNMSVMMLLSALGFGVLLFRCKAVETTVLPTTLHGEKNL